MRFIFGNSVKSMTSAVEARTLNSWAAELAPRMMEKTNSAPRGKANLPGTLRELLANRTTEMREFTSSVFPPVVHSLPVLYPFSGADVLTAHALFPDAPEYILVSQLPVGNLTCIASASCRKAATTSADFYFQHIRRYNLAWTSTNEMQKIFGPEVGVLPTLVVCARLMGHAVLTIRALSSRGIQGVVIETSGPRITYVSLYLKSDNDDNHWGWRPIPKVDEQAAAAQLHALRTAVGGPRRLFTLLEKASPHFINRAPFMTSWVLSSCAAALHDETGITPSAYQRANWTVRGFGRFVDWTFRERYWYRGEEQALKDLVGEGPELPFQFGYAAGGSPDRHVGNGMIMAAWRSDLSAVPMHMSEMRAGRLRRVPLPEVYAGHHASQQPSGVVVHGSLRATLHSSPQAVVNAPAHPHRAVGRSIHHGRGN
jgi:hypothetical protein